MRLSQGCDVSHLTVTALAMYRAFLKALPRVYPHLSEQSVSYAGIYSAVAASAHDVHSCLLYTSPSPRDRQKSRMPSSA